MTFRRFNLVLVLSVLCGVVGTAGAGALVLVDCGAGETISDALLVPDALLEIEFSGNCVEDVLITRDDVILRGADPSATITGVAAGPLEVRRGTSVNISTMNLTGGVQFGFKAVEANQIRIEDVVVSGNEQWGVVLGDGGSYVFLRTTVEANGFGAFATGGGVNASGGRVALTTCTVRNNTGYGDPGQRRVELQALNGARVTTTRGSYRSVLPPPNALEGLGDWAIFMDRGAHAFMRRGSIQGPFYLDDDARLELEMMDQTASTGNLVKGRSSLRGTTGSTLAGPTLFAEFSNGTFLDTTDVDVLDCVDASSNALCDPGVTGVGSNCALCPLP
jgi:hypothetical protein